MAVVLILKGVSMFEKDIQTGSLLYQRVTELTLHYSPASSASALTTQPPRVRVSQEKGLSFMYADGA